MKSMYIYYTNACVHNPNGRIYMYNMTSPEPYRYVCMCVYMYVYIYIYIYIYIYMNIKNTRRVCPHLNRNEIVELALPHTHVTIIAFLTAFQSLLECALLCDVREGNKVLHMQKQHQF